jgi:uncharacterized protein YdaU (DUF1376 family)
MHYYPFNIADFSLHTAHLTLEEEAVYRRLIDFYYDTETPIPKETQPVIRRLRLGSYLSEFEQVLSEFFTLEDDGWHSYRCDIEIKAYHDKADKARANGKKGGRPRKNKGIETQPVILANPDLTQTKANQELELRTKNHKPVTKEIVIPDGINNSAWKEWVDYRQSKKKKVSQKAADKQFKFLLDYALDLQQTIIDQSIQNDYQGLFEPKGNTNGQQIQSGRNASGGRLSAVERVKRAGENREQGRQAEVGAGDGPLMVETERDIRQHSSQPVRGADTGSMGTVIEGSYTRADR